MVASVQKAISELASVKHKWEVFWERTEAYLKHRGGHPKKSHIIRIDLNLDSNHKG